jgi:hypothetical protein
VVSQATLQVFPSRRPCIQVRLVGPSGERTIRLTYILIEMVRRMLRWWSRRSADNTPRWAWIFPPAGVLLIVVYFVAQPLASEQAANPDEIRLCRQGEMHPLNVTQVRNQLRAQGFHPTVEPDEGICSAEDVIASLDNNDVDHESFFGCAVRAAPLYSATPVLSVYRGSGKVDYTIGNVECTIYPDGSTSGRDAMRFDKVMRRLLALGRRATP